MPYYQDLREHLKALEEKGLLRHIKSKINKDTELHPLVSLQYRGLPEEERKAFLFENVVDSAGKVYESAVAVSALAGSREIYAVGMQCKIEELADKWAYAESHPIKPQMVDSAPVQEEVHLGDGLLEHGGLSEFPIPIATPGFDPGPYISAPFWVTKDPETGIRNTGTYRSHIKSPTRTGIFMATELRHIAIHWNKCRKLGIPLQAAIVIGGPPNIGYVSVNKFAYSTDEFDVAGGLAGEPVKLVKCKTVNLEVPANAEIIIEGEITTSEIEPEAPFGEFQGYMGPRQIMPYLTVTCITHRKNPIWLAFQGQFPPSENTKIVEVAREAFVINAIKEANITNVKAVAVYESSGACAFIVIQLENPKSGEAMRALEAGTRKLSFNKVCVAVDKDIDPWDAAQVDWAICYRANPQRDIKIIPCTPISTDFSVEPIDSSTERDTRFENTPSSSRMLIDATMKWPYPPTSMPKKEYMERAIKIWRQERLPELKLKEPWWGYSLGYWSPEEEEQARLAVEGRYYETGERIAKKRKLLQ